MACPLQNDVPAAFPPPVLRLIRIAGSAAILVALLAVVPADSLRAAFAQASVRVFLVASVIHFAAHLVAALKWRMLMGRDARVAVSTAFRAHFSGLVANLTPLGVVGGDLMRAGIAASHSTAPGAVVVTGVVDRIIDTTALFVLAGIGFFWADGRPETAATILRTGVVLLAAGFAATAAGLAWLRRTRNPRVASIRDAAEVMTRQPGHIALALLLSILVQGAFVSASAYIGTDVGVTCPLAAWLVAWPASKIIAYVPISVAGIGIRESALIALLRPFGGDPGAVMAAGLLWQAVFISGALAGWIGWSLLPGLRPRTRDRSS